MSLHADEGNGFPLTRLHHFPAVLRATNLQLPVAVILSSTIYTKLDAITLRRYSSLEPYLLGSNEISQPSPSWKF